MKIPGNVVGGILPDSVKVHMSSKSNPHGVTAEQVSAAVTNRVITSANTTTYSGMYRIQEAADVPSDCKYGQLLVMCHQSADTIAQIAIAHGSPKAYIRTSTDKSDGVVSTWSDWTQIYTTTNKPTADDVGARPNTWVPTTTEIGAAVGAGQVSVSANTITTSGMYRLQEATDIPSDAQYGQLVVVHGGGDTIAQVAFDYTGSKMWIRTGNSSDVGGSGTWGAWKRVITEGSFSYSNGTLTITI